MFNEIVEGQSPRLHVFRLKFSPFQHRAEVGKFFGDAGDSLVYLNLRLRRRIPGGDDLQSGTEHLDLSHEPLLNNRKTALLRLDLAKMTLQRLDLGHSDLPPPEGEAGEIFSASLQRPRGSIFESGHPSAELLKTDAQGAAWPWQPQSGPA